MVIIRPVAPGDLESLLDLSSKTGVGLTTLPHDEEVLQRRINDSQRGFARMADKPGGETYLFVMEDLEKGAVVGTSGLFSKVGGYEPFYAYRVETTSHESRMLMVKKEIKTLHLVMEHNGPSEIGSLFLSPAFRQGINGRLLSLSRFVFIADHRQYFDPVTLAEMRGVIDDKGGSPFWDALGHHFFDVTLSKADSLVMRDKRFIADLMPKHPIYIPILPKAAQEVIGEVHPETRPALKLLEGEGFAFAGMVDIFEGGPVVSCATDEIRTVRESRATSVYKVSNDEIESDLFIISNTYANGYRACAGPLAIVPGKGIQITKETAAALKLKKDDPVRIAPLKPGTGREIL